MLALIPLSTMLGLTAVLGMMAKNAGLLTNARYRLGDVLVAAVQAPIATHPPIVMGCWFCVASVACWVALVCGPKRWQRRMVALAFILPHFPLIPMAYLCAPFSPFWLLEMVLGADGEFYEDGGMYFVAVGWWVLANAVLLCWPSARPKPSGRPGVT